MDGQTEKQQMDMSNTMWLAGIYFFILQTSVDNTHKYMNMIVLTMTSLNKTSWSMENK